MSTEKSDAIVIRQADFSESSRVVTLFTRDFGKISCLAKGAKRLRNAFEGALDLLAECRVVFLHKSSSSLDLLTEAQLRRRFQPMPGSLSHLYGGYYVAELLNALTEEGDPHVALYEAAAWTLQQLSTASPHGGRQERPARPPDQSGAEAPSQPPVAASPHVPILKFELTVLHEIGQLPNFDTCTICQSPLREGEGGRFWVSQGGLICSRCGHSEYHSTELSPGSLAVLRKLAESDHERVMRINVSPQQRREIRRLLTAAISHVMGRRPKTLGLISF
jgi:DNA repair protein RecO (recombination protein O)